MSSESRRPNADITSNSYSSEVLQDSSRENIIVVSDAHFYGPESRSEAYELAETVNSLSEDYSIDRMISCGDLTDVHGLEILGEELEPPATFIPGDEDNYSGFRGISESHVGDVRPGGFRETIKGFEAAFAHNPRSYDDESDQDLFDTTPWETIGRRLKKCDELRSHTDFDVVNHGHSHVEFPRSRGFRVENSVGSYSNPHNMSKDSEVPERFLQIQSYGETTLDIISYSLDRGKPEMFQHKQFEKIGNEGIISEAVVRGSSAGIERFTDDIIDRYSLPGREEVKEMEKDTFLEDGQLIHRPDR